MVKNNGSHITPLKVGIICSALLAILLAVVIVNNGITGFQTATQSCKDTDGSNLNNKGTVTFTNYDGGVTISTDTCDSTGKLREFICYQHTFTDPVNTVPSSGYMIVTCDSGSTCVDGACVKITPPKCTDTDLVNNGLNDAVKGTTKIVDSKGKTLSQNSDTCVGTNIKEYHCSKDQKTIQSIESQCFFGTTCQNGACYTAGKEQCIKDSLTGTVIIAKDGKITAKKSDSCKDASNLKSYSCKRNSTTGTYTIQEKIINRNTYAVQIPMICKNGRFIPNTK